MTRVGTWIRRGGASLAPLLLMAGGVLAASSPVVDNRMRGKMDPLTLIEYSDFTCGYCLKFFKKPGPRFRRGTSRPAKCGSSIKTIPAQTRALA